MPTISCAHRIEELELQLDNANEAARWEAEQLRGELAARDAKIATLIDETINLRARLAELEPAREPQRTGGHRSRLRVVHVHR